MHFWWVPEKSHIRISGVTVGKIVDYGLKDSQNMGACMAPAAADTIAQNLQDLGEKWKITTELLPETWVRGAGYSVRPDAGKRL